MAKTEMVTAFPTLIGRRNFDEPILNAQLTADILREREADPEGIYRSNVAGTWHSKDKVTQRLGPAGNYLARMFHSVFSDIAGAHAPHKGTVTIALQPWAMVYGDRGYATVHTHPNCHFSGVYYVDAGPESPSLTMATGVNVQPGSIEFIDTRGGVGAQQASGLILQPRICIPAKTGTMLVFPCWLPHFVHPVVGDGLRIAVACNATIVKFEKEDK